MLFRKSTPKPPPLRLTSVEHQPSAGYSYAWADAGSKPTLRTLVTANQPIGVSVPDRKNGNTDFYHKAVTIERVLGRAGLVVDGTYPDDTPSNQLWLLRRAGDENELGLDELNDRLASDTTPAVRITHETSADLPGIMYAHRQDPLGQLARLAVVASPHVLELSRVRVADDPLKGRVVGNPYYKLYTADTLMVALAAPGSTMKDAAKAVQFGLTL